MGLSIDGNTITFEGVVTITNATDLTSGVATLMLTPSGGVGNIPALLQGQPGPAPIFDSVTVTTLAAGASATATLNQVSGGGPGIASHYTLVLGIPQGAAGTPGTMSISGASDLEGGPPSGTTDNYIIKWDNTDGKWKIVAELCGGTLNATVFTPASGNGSPQTLVAVAVPAQPFDWYPNPRGYAVAIGTANTHVDLICRLNDPVAGDQVGYGKGITGAGSTGIPAFPVTLIQSFGEAIGGAYGRVSKGATAHLYFQAIQTASTEDAFSVSDASCSFTVGIDPIPGTS